MRTNAMRTACAVLACLLAVPALRGQTSGQIRGTVVDDDGKALEGVKVEAKAASSTWTFTTRKDGQVHFVLLPPGTYKVTFTREAYSQVEKNATVRLDGTTMVNAKLFRLSG